MRRGPLKVVVVGAGIGGLTTAALLARAGLDVTVLEAHIYPGGCAGTFYHQGYRFDAGATLAAGYYPGGPMDLLARAVGLRAWVGVAADAVMTVHLPDAPAITRYAKELRNSERVRAFTPTDQRFWEWQENTADLMWDLALRIPPWPPHSIAEVIHLLRVGAHSLKAHVSKVQPGALVQDATRPLAHRLRRSSDKLRLFLDAQLLISAQAESTEVNALYAAAALDLPRRGPAHLRGGMGSIAEALADAVRSHGGRVQYRHEGERILFEGSEPSGVRLTSGDIIPADIIVANVPPWNLQGLLSSYASPGLRRLRPPEENGWGAFVVYAGAPTSSIPSDSTLHHQVVTGRPLGEGNSAFISVSPAWDSDRAPEGMRALTISTHTDLRTWWQLFHEDRPAYGARVKRMTEQVLMTAEVALPGIASAADPVLPGTPVTFNHYTRRASGWVAGFPQTRLLRGINPRIRPHVWIVGDSIFPGQSSAAVAMGGMRVAQGIANSVGLTSPVELYGSDVPDVSRSPSVLLHPQEFDVSRADVRADQTGREAWNQAPRYSSFWSADGRAPDKTDLKPSEVVAW